MFLTLVLAGCGIAGGIIAYFQWGALKEQVGKLGEAIKAETDAGKARAEENAAALATANAANEIAREIGQAQTRPTCRWKVVRSWSSEIPFAVARSLETTLNRLRWMFDSRPSFTPLILSIRIILRAESQI